MLKVLLKDYRFIFHASVLQAFLDLLPNCQIEVILIIEYLPSHVLAILCAKYQKNCKDDSYFSYFVPIASLIFSLILPNIPPIF